MGVLARVAENLYWLGRYLERAENTARLAHVAQVASSERYDQSDPWQSQIATLGAAEDLSRLQQDGPDATPRRFLLSMPESPSSIRTILTRARTLMFELREHTSREVFEEINRIYLEVTGVGNDWPATLLDDVRRSIWVTYELFDETVLLDEGTRWFRVGKHLERADMTSRIVDSKYFLARSAEIETDSPLDRYQWRRVLRSAGALEAYRKQNQGQITAERVIVLLFFDPNLPRSLASCLNALEEEFAHATEDVPGDRLVESAKLITINRLEINAAVAARVVESGYHDFIDRFQTQLRQIDEALTNDIFRSSRVADVEETDQIQRFEVTAGIEGGDS